MGRRKKSELDIATKIDDIMHVLQECHDDGSLEVIASEILGYPIYDEDIESDNGRTIIQECRNVLESITPPGEVDNIYRRLITHRVEN